MRYTTLTQKDLKWTKLSEEEIRDYPKKSLANIILKSEEIKNIFKSKVEQTFVNTILAYENISEDAKINGISMSHISLLSMCSDNEKVRDAARNAETEYSAGIVDIIYDIALYKAIKNYYNNNYKLEINSLDREDIKLVEDLMRGFSRMGFDLDTKDRNRLKAITKKIAKLANNYDARLAEDRSHILCSEEELSGLPENIVASFQKIGDKYRVSTEYPEYGPYMRYANDRAKREELYILFNNVGGKKNIKDLEELVALRAERAEILGHTNHGEFVTSDRMVKNTKNAYKMLLDVVNKIKDKKDKDIAEIMSRAAQDDITLKDFKSSDQAYYINKIRNEKYSYDEQLVREYLPLDHVLSRMFDLFGELFGFKVEETKLKTWHKDVKLYSIVDSKSGSNVGHFATDLYPREGKFSHACMMPITVGRALDQDNYRSGLIAIICNFSKPILKGKNKQPSLLTLGEVETLFHEFGHGIHSLLTRAKHESLSGTNVVWDFVETPSQIMEQWLTEKRVLKLISSHYKTGKSLPENMIKSMMSLEGFMKALFYTRQALQALLDLDIYTGKLGEDSLVTHYHKLMKKYLYKDLPEVLFVSRFAHIARGYDAGYYSYMWAERISRDMYKEFARVSNSKRDSRKLGAKYRTEILEMGSSRDENESVLAFLGREVDSEGFVNSML